jgi:hypothetical protein
MLPGMKPWAKISVFLVSKMMQVFARFLNEVGFSLTKDLSKTLFIGS